MRSKTSIRLSIIRLQTSNRISRETIAAMRFRIKEVVKGMVTQESQIGRTTKVSFLLSPGFIDSASQFLDDITKTAMPQFHLKKDLPILLKYKLSTLLAMECIYQMQEKNKTRSISQIIRRFRLSSTQLTGQLG